MADKEDPEIILVEEGSIDDIPDAIAEGIIEERSPHPTPKGLFSLPKGWVVPPWEEGVTAMEEEAG